MKIVSKITLVSMLIVNLGQSVCAFTLGKDIPKLFALLNNKSTKTMYMPNADLTNVSLLGVDFSLYESVNFHKANLSGANFSGASLSGSIRMYMEGPHVEEINSMNLTAASLRNANFSNANLSNADLRYADLTGAILIGAILSGTNLGNVKGLSVEQKNYARSKGALNVP